jgi:hypothetical protein
VVTKTKEERKKGRRKRRMKPEGGSTLEEHDAGAEERRSLHLEGILNAKTSHTQGKATLTPVGNRKTACSDCIFQASSDRCRCFAQEVFKAKSAVSSQKEC